jgi:hypothetical protein
MSTEAVYPLKLSPSLKKAAERLAAEDGVSLDFWINMAVAHKVGAVETADHLRARFGMAEAGALRSILDRVPDAPAVLGDEVPEDLLLKLGTP